MTPIQYALAACDTMMRKFTADALPPKGRFHYHQGVFLSGMRKTYALAGGEKYMRYIQDWIDSVFDADGNILQYIHGDLDDIQPGILLFPLLDWSGDKKYEKFLKSVYAEVVDIPVNSLGGYWHKTHLTDQMWLDGLYMAGPFTAEYAKRYQLPALAENVVKQALLMREKTLDEGTGLLYHAWDGAGKAEWADPVTGKSREFWGRAMGWVPVALLDDLDFLPEDVPGRDKVKDMATDLLTALVKYQSEDGRWYQVVNKGGDAGNWLENSCSCLYVAALCKAMRMGYMDRAIYEAPARRGYEGVIKSIGWIDQDIQIGNVCIGTGVGDYEHYIHRPVSVNDLHGVGAFLLMCAEMQALDEAK